MKDGYDTIVTLQDAMHFTATTDAQPEFTLHLDSGRDFGGTGKGVRPLDLMLVSLAGCSAMDVISILRKKQQKVTDLEVRVRADRATEHPKCFTHIWMTFVVTGHGVESAAVTRAIDLSMDKYCPSAAMIKQIIPIDTDFEILSA
jgi:putative redox protein